MGAATDSTHVQVTEAWQYSNEVKAIIGNTVFLCIILTLLLMCWSAHTTENNRID